MESPKQHPAATVVLPTLNERATVADLLKELDKHLSAQSFSTEILIVDDSSTDGTVEAALAVQTTIGVRAIVRKNQKGLASAVLRGFDESLGQVCLVMDADGSHTPSLAPALLRQVISGKAEMAIGSRYVEGGGIKNWGIRRRLISLGATLLAQPLTHGEHVTDPISGFFAIDKRILGRGQVNPLGYKIGFEILVCCRPHPVAELPYVFQDRLAGKSKMSPKQMTEYMRQVGQLYRYTYLGNASKPTA
jgi:dolichol-phosphate mannosyltransferase